MKISPTFLTILKNDLKNNVVPALMGEPGIGKTSIIRSVAKEMGSKAFVLQVNQLAEKADLTGARLVPYTKADGTETYTQIFYPHHVITSAVNYAEQNPREDVILLMDEINRAQPDVTSATLTITTERAIGETIFPDNLKIVVAGNTKGNVTTLDEASISRFSVYEVQPDASSFLTYMGERLNPHIRAVLEESPDLIFCKPTEEVFGSPEEDEEDTQTVSDLFDDLDQMQQFTTPRTIEALSDALNCFSDEELKSFLSEAALLGDRNVTILHEIVEAKTGNTLFSAKVIQTVSEYLLSASTPKNAPATEPVRIKAMDEIDSLRHSSIDELKEYFTTITTREREQALVYLLWQRKENRVIIECLIESIADSGTQNLDKETIRQVMELASHNDLDEGNVKALENSGYPLAIQVYTLVNAVF